ncbi:MAG: pyrroline-5-carboxylate reductase [Chloroflexi bacterium]|nr:pyrroline-5-carboxylate reductase [Chloroflexota bacterium]
MAEAIIAGLINTGLSKGKNILAAGPRPDRGTQLAERYDLEFSGDSAAIASLASTVVLSVKPQQLGKVLSALKGAIQKDALVLSIVAGASTDSIAAGLEHPAVARAMPNMPARIGKGITVWTASEAASPDQRRRSEEILGALGQTIYMEDESFLDKATALSGTGPSYVYLFMEAMVDAGVHLGFPRRIAEQLVVETLRGSVEFYDHSDEGPRHLARLRNQVTSPGGTSAEALYYLQKAGFRTAISRAIWAAYERSRGLGQGGDDGRNSPD